VGLDYKSSGSDRQGDKLAGKTFEAPDIHASFLHQPSVPVVMGLLFL